MEAAVFSSDTFNMGMRVLGGPSWRWRRAEKLAAAGNEPSFLDDEQTVAGWRYGRDIAGHGDQPRQADADRHPLLAAAHSIYVQNRPDRWQIEARLLTGATVESVAQRVGIGADVVQAYTELFFDVANHLNARDWISACAVGVGPWGLWDPNESNIWRWSAYHGGEIVLDLLVADYLSLPNPAHPNRHELAEEIRTLVRLVCVPLENRRLFRRVLSDVKEIEAKRSDARDPVERETLAQHIATLELAVMEPGGENGIQHVEIDARSEVTVGKDKEKRKSRRHKLVGAGQAAGV
jgi:hypothetical protein